MALRFAGLPTLLHLSVLLSQPLSNAHKWSIAPRFEVHAHGGLCAAQERFVCRSFPQAAVEFSAESRESVDRLVDAVDQV
eukprot:6210445-Pleurochrysis_carterae.AAC.1